MAKSKKSMKAKENPEERDFREAEAEINSDMIRQDRLSPEDEAHLFATGHLPEDF